MMRDTRRILDHAINLYLGAIGQQKFTILFNDESRCHLLYLYDRSVVASLNSLKPIDSSRALRLEPI
jgi:hypothetical protein